MDRFNLKLKAALAAGLLATGLIIAGVLLASFPSISAMQAGQLYDAVAHAADELDQAILMRQRTLVTAADLLGRQMPGGTNGTAGFGNFLQEHQMLSAMFDDVFLVNLNARVADSMPDKNGWKGLQVGDRPYFKQTLSTRKPVISQPFLDKPQDQPSIVMTAPVLDRQNRVVAVLGARLNLSKQKLIDEVREKRIGESGYFYLMTRDGLLLSHPQRERIMQRVPEPAADIADNGGTLEWHGARRLQSVDWVLAAVLPAGDAGKAHAAPWPMVALVAACVLVSMLLAWFAMRGWLAPLGRLQKAIETMRDDPHAHVAIPLRRKDEIGAVTAAFNGLMHERRHAVQGLIAEKEWVAVTLNSIADAVVTTDSGGRVEYLNQVAESLTGWQNDQARGQQLSTVLHIIDEQTQDPVALLEQALAEKRAVTTVRQGILTRRDGSTVPIDDSAAPIRDGAGQLLGFVFVLHDVTQQRNATNRARWEAEHDALTGLANRRAFEGELSATIRNAGKSRMQSYLFLLDLDHFKQVNDTGGHAAGDALLKQIAKLLQSQVRSVDLSARLGGDEFAILLKNCPQQEAIHIAHKIRQAIWDLQFTWGDAVFHVGVSIGATLINAETVTMRQALQQADEACYQSKAAGRNNFALFGTGVVQAGA
ncbi:MAG: diguanylate cyclase [Noviherbaspirillum sp.]